MTPRKITPEPTPEPTGEPWDPSRRSPWRSLRVCAAILLVGVGLIQKRAVYANSVRDTLERRGLTDVQVDPMAPLSALFTGWYVASGRADVPDAQEVRVTAGGERAKLANSILPMEDYLANSGRSLAIRKELTSHGMKVEALELDPVSNTYQALLTMDDGSRLAVFGDEAYVSDGPRTFTLDAYLDRLANDN